ncbi:DUF1836 domain-containing protein [Clostridium saudiense]|nr:DUF1836 domain-containing protein [Clostridium saudiense]MBM6859688.1 DUF1836 domain-containing protein [Clostridium saudiense]
MNKDKIHLPRFNELPRVPLYKDQVITYLEEVAKLVNVSKDEKILTPTMLNNYVKQKVVSPPKDKKYNEKHLAYLIVVCVLKQVFSLQEICNLINVQIESFPIDTAYDYFCTEVEKAIEAVFVTRDFSYPSSASETSLESEMVRSTVMAVAHKLYIQKQLMDTRNNSEKNV